MRVLFVTNFYPPYGLGGQSQSCQEVVEALQNRGHVTFVLTSMYGRNNRPLQEDCIARALYLEMDFTPWRHMITFFTDRKRREQHNIARFGRYADGFQPDVIFVWGMWNIARSLVRYIESEFAGRVVYRFADYWPTLPSQHELYWRERGRRWFSRGPKMVLRPVALKILEVEQEPMRLKFEHAFCISAATKRALLEEGVPIDDARIIHNGIDVGKFAQSAGANVSGGDGLRLLYAGRLAQEKGVTDAIRAVSKLVHEQGISELSLNIAGEGEKEYEASLRRLVRENNAEDFVHFVGQIAPVDMPRLFQSHDILLFPSIWEEPFGRVILEAMASSMAVIASKAGGPAEIIVDGETGLLFEPGDVDELAACIKEMVENASLRRRLIENGFAMVEREFVTSRMVDEIEAYLGEVVNETPPLPEPT